MSPNHKRNHHLRLALLISGGGTTMAAIIKACKDGQLPKVEPALVISSTSSAGGLEKAEKLGIPKKDILVINPKDFKDAEEFGREIIKECEKRRVNFVGQYGWMALTPGNVIKKFSGHIVNQHPGPLDNGRPDFGGKGMYGMRVHKARLEFVRATKRDYWTEATAHRVTSEFDKGEVVKRRQMSISPNERTEHVKKRLLPVEHEVQIETLLDFSEGVVHPFKRKDPLVRPEEMKILEKCKAIARKAYPNG